ncbi:hypothetical protein [Streptosporangium saharense]|uniref:Bacteriocin biosynthesis cyclodehydratase domain-containing protein n=1 Tax=Streptosporangium saharense TaxID=1706840 RepID=A0A7W7VN92_9ACTN|nr:hypothetical protein [Streptosporangium saharense]MBB4915960.1 bacteriocin biosynthesis cyclodehydratase domain-containing protein [Streptosporangium saharense]
MESIAPGHHLYVGPDGTWRSCDENERFTRLTGRADLLERMREQAYLGGNAPDLEPLVTALRERGVLTDPSPGGGEPLRVCVRGEGPVAAETVRLLAGTGTALAVDDPATADAVVECAGWLPDGHWLRLDDDGAVRHRCHVEGRRLVVGPMTVPGRTASYRDLRGRRLAAAALPDELAGLWTYLDEGVAGTVPLPPVPWPNPGAVAVAAGLLVNDLLTWWAGDLPATSGLQLVVDPASGRVERHPVLPLPVR